MNRTLPFSKPSGFTLIELMMTMAIGMIILLLAATFLGSTGDSYERVGGGVGAEREARAVLSQLQNDLANAHFHRDSLFEANSNAWPADRIGFLSLQSTEAQSTEGYIGDLCAIHYYLKDLNIGGKSIRCLMRGFRESQETFQALRNNNIASLFTEQAKDEPVAFGVVSFQARPKFRGETGAWNPWTTGSDADRPEALEVQLVIARRDLIGKFQSSSDWNGSSLLAARLLGSSDRAGENRNLESYGTQIRFGHDDTP